MDKIMKNKKGLELATNLSFNYKSMFRKTHFLVWRFESGNYGKESIKATK